ncbi:MAG: hypothetical protein IJB63_04155 [Alistipes sp.]|nr:hypothetical protein [Alistipes sp.]
MKKFIPYIACGLLLISGWACTRTDDLDVVGVEQGKIVIRTALDPQVETRVVADESAERKITRIDVVVVDPATGTIVHREVHEKADGLNDSSAENGNGTLTLQKERNTFAANKAYNIYLIANASAAIAAKIEDDSATTTLDDLKRLVQEDYTSTTANGATTFSTLLHLSGTTTPQATAPQTFLMDAVVTQAKGSEVRDIVLYNGVQTENTEVYAEFKRAAAKVIINIKQGSSVEFKRTLNLTADDNNGVATTGDAQYEFYNLPTETKVLAEGYDLGRDNNTLIETELITIPKTAEGGSYPTFVWKDDVVSVGDDGGDVKVQIIGYADAHEWANVSTLNYEPSLLLNLPIMWDANKDADKEDDGDGKETGRGGNWYKVPLSQYKVFERNTCYIVNITINAVGAESKSEAIELDDIDYDTRPWDVTTITIGGDSERPKYLKLNTDLVTMYNTNIDTEQLVFSSSSPITSIVLADVYTQNADGTFTSASTDSYYAYYIDKYGNKQTLDEDIVETISAEPDKEGALSGKIIVTSPIMPTSEAEIQQMILERLGPPKEVPTIEQPSYDGDIPSRPETVIEPSYPVPDDYIASVRQNGNWSDAGWGVYERNRTVTVIQYRYIKNPDDTYTFQSRTGTTTDTQTREFLGSWYDSNITYGSEEGITNWSDWTYDETKQNEWERVIEGYKNQLDEYNQYLIDLAYYEQRTNELESDELYQQYLTDLVAYNDAWETYRTEKAQYDADAADIRAEFEGGEETHYNTIRYLEFEVTNEEGLTALFRVMQYPVIYITHVMGWYSYRDDFYGTTWEKQGDPNNRNNCEWSNNQWNYSHNTSNNNAGQFRSKVYNINNEGFTGNSSQDNYPIDYYYWSNNNKRVYNAGSLNNPRMYFVNVTATSSEYIIGKPILDANGYTDSGADNARLVSPSFMIASQLGATSTFNNRQSAESHCSRYIEVAQDGTIYDDWRLPTAAEINIIIDLQYDSKAMDPVLTGATYWSASGAQNTGTGDGTNRTRCIRDAYNDPKEN